MVKHCLAVAKLAVFLAHKLKDNAVAVNVDLVDRASLLHDILRICDMKESEYRQFEKPVTERDKATWGLLKARYDGICHEEAAGELLKAKYPALALTIRKHRYTAILNALKDRLEEAHKRNVHLRRTRAQSEISTAKVDSLIFKLEEEIFNEIGLDPLEVTDEFVDSHSNTQSRTNHRRSGDG